MLRRYDWALDCHEGRHGILGQARAYVGLVMSTGAVIWLPLLASYQPSSLD